jgi:hypothetical protein
MDISRENTNVVQIGQKYRPLCTTTHVRLIVIGDFKSLQQRFLRVKRYQAVRIAEGSKTRLRGRITSYIVYLVGRYVLFVKVGLNAT